MPGKPGKQQGLFEDGSLIGFLQSTLEAMEAAAGGQLGEERAKLQELQLALGGLGLAASRTTETDELVLASQLDKLEMQLKAVERQFAIADEDTKELVTSSTAVWAGAKAIATEGSSSKPAEGAADTAAGSSGCSDGRESSAGGDGDVVGSSSGTDRDVTDSHQDTAGPGSSLVSVAEAAEEEEEGDG